MKSESEETRELTWFLLGALPAAETARIEQRFFSDTDFFERLCAIEEDLVCQFLKGELSPPDRELFEDRLNRSEDLRRKTEMARSIIAVLDRKPSAPPHSAPAAARARSWWQLRDWGRPLAFSAALASLAFIAWLLIVNTGLRKRIDGLQAELRGRQGTAEIAFLLRPGAVRGAGNPVRLRIPAAVDSVLLRLQTGDLNYPRYTVVLRSIGQNAELWSSVVESQFSRGAPVLLETRIPSVVLLHGDYVLQLNGMDNSVRIEPVEYYTFSVDRE